MDEGLRIDRQFRSELRKLGFIKDDNADYQNYDKKVEINVGYSSKKVFISIYTNSGLVDHYTYNFNDFYVDFIISKILNLPEFKDVLRALKLKKICVAAVN